MSQFPEIGQLLFVAVAKPLVRSHFFFQLFMKCQNRCHPPADFRLGEVKFLELIVLSLQMPRAFLQATLLCLVFRFCKL